MSSGEKFVYIVAALERARPGRRCRAKEVGALKRAAREIKLSEREREMGDQVARSLGTGEKGCARSCCEAKPLKCTPAAFRALKSGIFTGDCLSATVACNT